MSSRRQAVTGLTFTSPAIIAFLIFWLLPVALTLFYSFTTWRLGSSASFVGVQNFVDLLGDPLFISATLASLKIAAFAVIPSLLLAMLLAIALADPRIRLGRFWRVLFMVPVVTDWVATGLVWQLILLPNQGVLASMAQTLGLDFLVRVPWTADATLAPIAIAVFIIWKQTSLYMIFFYAAIRSVPGDVIEAARVDGATPWQVFWRITWPLMRPITVFVVVLSFITTLGLFEPVYMLTGGGPANATRTLPIFLYENFFTYARSGYASAAGVLFLAGSLAFAVICSRIMKEEA